LKLFERKVNSKKHPKQFQADGDAAQSGMNQLVQFQKSNLQSFFFNVQ